MKNTISLQSLMDQQTPGGKGLLAHEILSKQGRRFGPLDGKCEVCGTSAERFILQDWLHWHCEPCAVKAL